MSETLASFSRYAMINCGDTTLSGRAARAVKYGATMNGTDVKGRLIWTTVGNVVY